jgi:hypothetical protein
MRMLECRCVVWSWQLTSMLALLHASGCTHREAVPGHAEPVFHVVGVGWDVMLLMLCGGLRSRTGMTGRRTSSLLVTERGAAALGALGGTYLVRYVRELTAPETSNARATRS